MGGDHGPRVTLAACRAFLERHSEASLLLVGAPAALAGFAAHPRARIVAASEVVGMDDPIEIALRKKKDSSMRVAIQQVKDGAAQAAVSAGNTGALMAIARYLLKTLDGIDRPAIAPQLPNAKGGATTVLDLGANVDCDAEDLLQFAVLGSALVSALTGNEAPSVGLFWRSPAPGAPPFVEVGSRVGPDDTLAIIEVMKLMSPLKAGRSGVVTAIVVDNGATVARGEPLVFIDPGE